MGTVDGKADFSLSVYEPHGFGSDPTTLTVATKAFVAPLLRVTDYAVTGREGAAIVKRVPFDLQLLVKNVEYGQAEEVEVSIGVPDDVLLMEGEAKTSIPTMAAGDKRLLNYALIVNNNYTQNSVPVRVDICERYGKYAESKILTLALDQTFAHNRIEIGATDDENTEIIRIARLERTSFRSDVDENIPTGSEGDANTFAVIVANETYQRESGVEFAYNDGSVFREYCIRTLGLPEKNVHYVTDATLNNIRAEINWITGVARAYGGEAKLIFYYAGHGISDETTRTACLFPSDGFGSDVTTGYKLSDLYVQLSACPSRATIVLLDACFSGAQRSGRMLASARGIAIKAKTDVPAGDLIVFAAATGDETAHPYREKGHGMFTYFLLKKSQETKGEATLGEIVRYVTQQVG